MSHLKLNFYEIISSYLICKASEDFLNNVGGQYDSSDLSLISSLVNGFKRYNFDLDCPFRFKTYMAYLISIFARYFSKKDEESLYEILQTLFNQKSEIIIPIQLLKFFKRVVLKKVLYLMETRLIQVYRKEFSRILQSSLEALLKQTEIASAKTGYPDDQFYQETSMLIKQYVYAENVSILLELTKNMSLNSQSEEIELIDHFSSFKRKKLFKSKKRRRKDWSESGSSETSDEELSKSTRRPKRKQMMALKGTSTFESSLAIRSDLEEVLLSGNETNEYLNQGNIDAIQSAISDKDYSPKTNSDADNSRLADFLLESVVFEETANDVIREISGQNQPMQEVQTQTNEIIRLDQRPRRKRGRKRKLLPDEEPASEKIKSSKKHFWEDSETFYLVVGVELYGRGKWAKILHEFAKKFKNRTCMNLKDKYRNLEKAPEELEVFEKKARELIDKASKKHNLD